MTLLEVENINTFRGPAHILRDEAGRRKSGRWETPVEPPKDRVHSPRKQAFVSKIGGNQIVRTSAAANIDPGRGGTDQITVAIERVQKARLVGPRIRLNSRQRFFVDEKRCLDGAVVPPEPDRAPRRII